MIKSHSNNALAQASEKLEYYLIFGTNDHYIRNYGCT